MTDEQRNADAAEIPLGPAELEIRERLTVLEEWRAAIEPGLQAILISLMLAAVIAGALLVVRHKKALP